MRHLFIVLSFTLASATICSGQGLLKKMQASKPQIPQPRLAVLDTDKVVLVVRSNIENVSFKTDRKNSRVFSKGQGEWWVYLEPGTNIITFSAPGFQSLTEEIFISEKDRCKEIEITPITIPDTSIEGDLQIESKPSGAKIFLNNVNTDKLTPSVFENVKVSEIRLEKEKYKTAIKRVQLNPSKVTLVGVNLEPLFGYITVDTRHTDATLFINGIQKKFQVGSPIEVNAGELSIELKKQYYPDFITKVRVNPNDDPKESIPVRIELIRQKGRLRIDTNPRDAKVYLANDKLGDTRLIN